MSIWCCPGCGGPLRVVCDGDHGKAPTAGCHQAEAPLPRYIERAQAPLLAAMHDAARLIDAEIGQWLDRKSRAFPVLRKAFERLVNAAEEVR